MKNLKPVMGWSIVTRQGKLTTLVCQTKSEAVDVCARGERAVKVRVVPVPERRKR